VVFDYSIKVLEEQRVKLQDKLFEITDGEYDKYPKENVEKLKTDITDKLKDIDFAIKVLKKYQDTHSEYYKIIEDIKIYLEYSTKEVSVN
jgi:hypothetical protein